MSTALGDFGGANDGSGSRLCAWVRFGRANRVSGTTGPPHIADPPGGGRRFRYLAYSTGRKVLFGGRGSQTTMIAGHDEGISSLITIANKTICSIA